MRLDNGVNINGSVCFAANNDLSKLEWSQGRLHIESLEHYFTKFTERDLRGSVLVLNILSANVLLACATNNNALCETKQMLCSGELSRRQRIVLAQFTTRGPRSSLDLSLRGNSEAAPKLSWGRVSFLSSEVYHIILISGFDSQGSSHLSRRCPSS